MNTTAINEFLAHLSAQGTSLLQPIVAIGVSVMAIIQTMKDLFPVRRWFQRSYVRRWLGTRIERLPDKPDPRVALADAERHLLTLSTAGDLAAFYDLPIEQLCGQMNAAAQVVLDFPARHQPLLRSLASEADPGDVETVIGGWPPAETGAPGSVLPGVVPPAVTDARRRVTNQVQRSIDGLQIAAGNRWKLWLQIAAFALSFVLTTLAAASGASAWPLSSALLYGLLGGFLAPVARDLFAAVQNLRP